MQNQPDFKKNTIFKDYLFFIILLITPICYFAINTVIFKNPFSYFLSISIYFIFVLMLPGIVILNLVNYRKSSGCITIAFGLGIGFILNLLLYIFIFTLGLNKFFPLLITIYSIVFIILFIYFVVANKVLIKKDFRLFRISKEKFFVAIIFSIILFVIQFLAYNLPNLPPLSHSKYYNTDNLYWMGNAVALKKSFPPMDIRSYGSVYGYHYFTSIAIALISKSFNIPVFIICSAYWSVISNYLIIFSSTIIFYKTLKRNWKVILALILMIFTTGFQSFTIVYYYEHLISNPFSFDYGISFSMLTLILVLECSKKKSLIFLDYLSITIFFFVTAGVKIPNACILFLFIATFLLYKLIKKNNWKQWFLLIIIDLFVLFIGYIFLFSGSFSNTSVHMTITFFDSFIRNTELFKILYIRSNNTILSMITTFFILPFFINPILCILFLFAVFKVFMIKNITSMEISLILTIIGGYILLLCVTHNGLSQMYYIMSLAPYLVIIGLYRFKIIYSNKIVNLLKNEIFLLLLILSVGLFSCDFFVDAKNSLTQQKNLWSNEYLSKNGYNAFTWIRDNTPDESLIASNLSLENDKTMTGVSVFTERQMWIECVVYSTLTKEEISKRLKIIDSFNYNYDIDAYAYMKQAGIDYFISLKELETNNQSLHIKKSMLKLSVVYENDEIVIYKF